MAWIYFPELEELPLDSANGLNQFATSKSTSTLKECLSHELKRKNFQTLQFGTILKPSMDTRLETWLISFMAVSHARTLALQESKRAWKQSEVGFFSRLCGWPKKSGRHSFSLKTSQLSELKDLISLGRNWPTYGMIVDGALYPLTTWERRTKEKDGFCLPTPMGSVRGACKKFDPKAKSASARSLETFAKNPTCWPTPTARDWKGGNNPKPHGKHSPSLDVVVGGKLSPMWVEWLMNYPFGWTELNVSVMRLFPAKLQKRLGGYRDYDAIK